MTFVNPARRHFVNTLISLTDTYFSPQPKSVHVNVKALQRRIKFSLASASAITGYIQHNHFPCWCLWSSWESLISHMRNVFRRICWACMTFPNKSRTTVAHFRYKVLSEKLLKDKKLFIIKLLVINNDKNSLFLLCHRNLFKSYYILEFVKRNKQIV